MISKPKDYDNIPLGGERLTPGGHKCVIMQVIETTSSKGSQMLIISFDTDSADTQPMYYQNRYLNDKRPDKKWSGNMYLVVDGEYGPANLKRFCTAVEDSNANFSCWSQQGVLLIEQMKNKRVGIVFREEDYTKDDGTVGNSVKPMRFCNYFKAMEEKVPDRKPLPAPSAQAMAATAPVSGQDQQNFVPFQQSQQQPARPDYGFVAVPDGLEDEGLPFN